MKLLVTLTAIFAATATATAADDNAAFEVPFTLPPTLGPNISTICNSTKFDSIESLPNGDIKCFDSKKEWVGVGDFVTTGASVFNQVPHMNVGRASKCMVMLLTDPFQPNRQVGAENTEIGEFGARTYSVLNDKSGVWTNMGVTVLDWRGSYHWIDTGLPLESSNPVNYMYFYLYGSQCVRNIVVACNGAASNGFGNVAVSLGKGYWENTFGTQNIPWENCGPDGMGVKPKLNRDYEFVMAPYALTGDFNTFKSASNFKAKSRGPLEWNIADKAQWCYSRYDGSGPSDSYYFGCSW